MNRRRVLLIVTIGAMMSLFMFGVTHAHDEGGSNSSGAEGFIIIDGREYPIERAPRLRRKKPT